MGGGGEKPKRKHLFSARSSESAADAFTESTTAADLTNLHIQSPLQRKVAPVRRKAWSAAPERDTPTGLREEERKGGAEGAEDLSRLALQEALLRGEGGGMMGGSVIGDWSH